MFAVDVDAKNGGFESIKGFLDLPETLSVATGGRGQHLYFKMPSDGSGIGNRANWLPGVDIRGNGGHVIAPPSLHASGARYSWQNWGHEIAEAPEVLVESIRSSSTNSDYSFALKDPLNILNGVPEGQRDETLFRWACRLRRQHENDVDEGYGLVLHLVLEAAKNCGFPENEARRKVEQAYKQDHRDAPLPDWGSSVDSNSRLVEGGVFVLDEPDKIPAIWGTSESVLWAEGEGLMIAGHQGLGKTTIAQQLVLARIGIRPSAFLEFPVMPSKGRILYLAMDRPRQAARSFRRMVNEQHRQLMDDRLIVWKGPLPVDPTKKGHFIEWIKEVAPDADTVVVDSVKDLAPGVTDDTVASSLNSAWQSVIAEDIDLLLLHHERKAASDSKRHPSLDNVYGSTWLTSGLGSVIALIGEPGGDEVTLHHLKQPAETVGPLDIEHDQGFGLTSIRAIAANPTVAEVMQGGAVLNVDQLSTMTQRSTASVRRDLKKLIAEGSVIELTPATNNMYGRHPATYRMP